MNQSVSATGESASQQLAALETQRFQGTLAAPAQPTGEWVSQELFATANVPPPTFSPGNETRRLISRRTAIYQAYRDLAAQIERLRAPDGRTVAEHAANENVRRQIEDTIQKMSRVVEESERPDNSYSIKMALRTDSMASIFSGSQPSMAASPQGNELQLRQLVQQQAEQNGRSNLMMQVRSALSNESGKTIGEKMDEDLDLRNHVSSLVQEARPQSVEFLPGGMCRVKFSLNLDLVRQWPPENG